MFAGILDAHLLRGKIWAGAYAHAHTCAHKSTNDPNCGATFAVELNTDTYTPLHMITLH